MSALYTTYKRDGVFVTLGPLFDTEEAASKWCATENSWENVTQWHWGVATSADFPTFAKSWNYSLPTDSEDSNE